MNKFFVTTHARDRFAERFGVKYGYSGDVREILKLLYEEAEENRAVLNDTAFMLHIHESYGFDKQYRFLVHQDTVFVGVEDHEKNKVVIVTCLSNDTRTGFRKAKVRKKFKKKGG